MADPALAARLLGASSASLLSGESAAFTPRDRTLLGALFESLVTLTIRVAAQQCEATVRHLRTRNGDHEVELVIERDDHKALAVEVKLADTITDRDTAHLRWLESKLGHDLLDKVVVTAGEHAYRRPDGIAVVPLGLLGP